MRLASVVGFGVCLTLIAGVIGHDARAAILAGNHVAGVTGLTVRRQVAADRSLKIRITMALRNRDQLEALLVAQQDPSSPRYHRWLTPDEFNDRFGPSADDLAMVEGWLTKSGFSVESASMSRRNVVASASAATVESALNVKIHSSADGFLYGNLEDPVVPATIAPLISSIEGLTNTAHFQSASPIDAAPVANPDVLIDGELAFGPQDTWAFYDETELLESGINGSGVDCIAVIETSDFPDQSVDLFNSTFNLPSTNLTRIYPDGSSPGETDEQGEALLDVEYSHAAAPGAAIVAYIGSGDDALIDAITAAVQQNRCGIVSISFGFCGEPKSFYQGTIYALFNQAASQGQAVFISAGDEGAPGRVSNGRACVTATSRHVNEMSAHPLVTSAGGTQFTPTYGPDNIATGYSTESVWRHPQNHSTVGATGGGISKIYPKPLYQLGLFPRSKRRNVPDIAFASSPVAPGFFFAKDDQIKCCIGGTSLSAPYWAGITALAEQIAAGARLGNLNTKLYQLGPLGDTSKSGLHDITDGRNSLNGVRGFPAKIGYDRTTGWGTPDIGILAPLLAQ